jgi:uroporphyrin-3 C-methyltransferase
MPTHDASSTSSKGTNRSALIIVGIFAMLGLAYSLVRVYVLRERIASAQADIRVLQDANSVLQASVKELQTNNLGVQDRLKTLDGLQGSISDINNALGELRGRTEQSQQHWARVESLYLLRLAQDQLKLAHDVPTAIVAMEAAAARLTSNRDTASSAARVQIEQELRALRSVPQIDSQMIYAQLRQATEQAPSLPVAGRVVGDTPQTAAALSDAGLDRAWVVLKRAFRSLFSVRQASSDSSALVTHNERLLRQRQLQLLLVSATQALQYRNNTNYQESLQLAVRLLDDSFSSNDVAVRNLRATLLDLAQHNIAPTLPDVSKSLTLLERELPAEGADK